jgi:hypothetical protein
MHRRRLDALEQQVLVYVVDISLHARAIAITRVAATTALTLFSQNTNTGGGVFCNTSNKYTSFASCLT